MPDSNPNLDPVEFGKMQSDVEHLKGQSEITHNRITDLRKEMNTNIGETHIKIDKVGTEVHGLKDTVTKHNTDVIGRLNAIQHNHAGKTGFFKGAWRAIAIGATVIAFLVTAIASAFNCVMNG